MSLVEERRRKARAMVDEDDTALPPVASTSSSTGAKKTHGRRPAAPRSRCTKQAAEPATPPRASTSQSPSSASPRLALTLRGKVYRTLDPGSGLSTEGNLFGEPDERVEDMRAEKGDQRRRELELERLRSDDVRGRLATVTSKYTPSKRQVIERDPSPPRRAPPRAPDHTSPPPTLGRPFSDFHKPSSSASATATALPEPLAALLSLHILLESTLVLQLARSGAAVASSSSQTNAAGEAVLRIPNLVPFPELRNMMERGGGRSFSERELARLVWVWEGCGQGEGSRRSTPDEDDDDEDDLSFERSEAGGMGFVITKTRTGSARSIVTTHGIGISVAVRANPQLPAFELLPPRSPGSSRALGKKVAPPSPGSVGRGREGMSVVALWNQGQDGRREEFASRLRVWFDRCTKLGLDFTDIPQASLPPLAAAISVVPGTISPKKKTPVSDVFGPAIPIALPNGGVGVLVPAKPAPKGTGTAEERRRAMVARLQAKANAGHSAYQASISALSAGGSTIAKSLKPDKDLGSSWRIEAQELYQRKSLLSRLGNVADGVWMIFEVGHVKSKLLYEVGMAIAKSSKVNLSLDEAQESLRILCELCPDFTYISRTDRQDWLRMKGNMSLKDVKARVDRELGREKDTVGVTVNQTGDKTAWTTMLDEDRVNSLHGGSVA